MPPIALTFSRRVPRMPGWPAARRAVWWLLLCGLIGWAPAAAARATFTRDGKMLRLANDKVATIFNLDSGEWEVLAGDGLVVATALKFSWGEPARHTAMEGTSTYGFGRVHTELDSGTRITVARGTNDPFDLVLTIYDHLPCVLAQLRGPLSAAKEVPITLEGGAFPNTPWAAKTLVRFQAAPEWTGTVRRLEGWDRATNDWSAGGFGLRSELKDACACFVVLRQPAQARMEILAPESNEIVGLKFAARWTQPVQPMDSHPQQWESAPLVFIPPLTAAKTAALVRRLMETSPPDFATAIERLPAAEAPAVAR